MRLPAQTFCLSAVYSPRHLCQFGGWGGEETVRNGSFGLFRAWPEVKNDSALRAKSENCQAAAADGGLSRVLANKAFSARRGWHRKGGGVVIEMPSVNLLFLLSPEIHHDA